MRSSSDNVELRLFMKTRVLIQSKKKVGRTKVYVFNLTYSFVHSHVDKYFEVRLETNLFEGKIMVLTMHNLC